VVYDRTSIQKSIDLMRRVAPSLVFTHPRNDYMMDHEESSRLAQAASFIYGAPNASELPILEGTCVPYLYYVDTPEGIDTLGNPLVPTTLIDISAQLEKKTEMLAAHASQREWLRAHHGTDEYLDAMRRRAVALGQTMGVAAAEAFVQHRGHSYPRNDLLIELLGGQRG
jgi:LmbE family N-acetylglucosaminyl deacetylase